LGGNFWVRHNLYYQFLEYKYTDVDQKSKMHHTSDPPKVTQNEALAYLIPTMYCMWHSVSIRVVAEVRDA
jgi:hypothetical protein